MSGRQLPDTRRALKLMQEEGLSAYAAAQRTGISYTCIYSTIRKLREQGVDVPNKRRTKKPENAL